MKKRKFPTAHLILLVIAAFVAILTWLIPAGQYATLAYDSSENVFIKTVDGKAEKLPAISATLEDLNIQIPLENFTSGAIYKAISIPGTYKSLEARPQGVFEFVQAPIKGLIETADIIFLILIIGGIVAVVEKSGAFSAGVQKLSESLKGREYILIITTILLTALGGTSFGFGEEGVAFLPILIPLFLAAKYDAIVPIACVFLGSQVGVMTSTTNPFSTILASDAAGILWTTGLQGRVIMFVICVIITIIYILRYAKKVRVDPSKSVIYQQKAELEKLFGLSQDLHSLKLTSRHKLILLVFVLCFVAMVSGVIMLDWWFVEMTSVFLVGAIAIGIIARMKELDFVNAFMKGAGELLSVAFIIGLARGISILMTDGLISDTILYYAGGFTQGMEKGVFINALFGIYNLLTFFVPSTSGMAVLTVPIIAPLSDTVDIGREVMVNAYQYGNGLFNLINPTSLILTFLGVAHIGYDRFLKFVWPLLIILILVIISFLTISVY